MLKSFLEQRDVNDVAAKKEILPAHTLEIAVTRIPLSPRDTIPNDHEDPLAIDYVGDRITDVGQAINRRCHGWRAFYASRASSGWSSDARHRLSNGDRVTVFFFVPPNEENSYRTASRMASPARCRASDNDDDGEAADVPPREREARPAVSFSFSLSQRLRPCEIICHFTFILAKRVSAVL